MALAERLSYIISLWPRVCGESNRPHGFFSIAGAPPCETHHRHPCRECAPYGVTTIRRAVEAVDEGFKKRHLDKIDDQELAADLASGVAHFGVLAIAGSEPTEAELAKAKAALDEYAEMTFEMEQKIWAATDGKPNNREHAIIAATWLGRQAPWVPDLRPKVACIGCGNMNVPSSVKCGNASCGAIINWEKARQLGLVTKEQYDFAHSASLTSASEEAPVRRGPGRPRKVDVESPVEVG